MAKKTVLIVDDESTIRWILKVALEVKELTILEASSGEEGVQMCKEIRPDLIIMDYKMPDMNGWQATTEIKKLYPDMVVIGHTGFANDKDIEEGYRCGCTTILHKPVDLDEWESVINKYLGI